ncbi:MAG: hypothetical protein J6032_00965, partial [Bacteroidales bacterium]|nr:hypothetical protein [Bacteroidales bacterium]
RLVYQSSNNLPAEPKNGNLHVHGVGMKVLRRRLKLLYPDCFELTANLEGGRFVTKLEVRLNG